METKTSWKKGVSGNPNGRPKKGETFTDILNAEYDKRTLLDRMWARAIEEDDFQAMKYLMDRWDGTPRQTLDATIEMPEVVGFYPDDYERATGEDTEANSQ
jgi:hypothetical protein